MNDLQFDLAELRALLEHAEDFDVVAGYRAPRRDPFGRRLLAFGWGSLVRTVFGLRVRDIDCAFKLFRREVIEAMGARVRDRGIPTTIRYSMGGDIAAACFRGLLAYKLVEPQEPFPLLELNNTRGDVVADVARIAEMSSPGDAPLPPGVRIEAVWTGAPASSTQLIGRVELALAKDPERVRDALERIAACAEDGIRALESNNSADFIRVIDEAGEAMDALGLLCEAPIVTALHRKLARSVRAAGAACKPSGAGGGDFSLIVGASDLDWGAILGDLPEGCEHIALRIVSKG